MNKQKTVSFVAFLLMALLLVKVSAFHIYTHHDDSANGIDNCNICHLAVETQSLEQQIALVFSFDAPRCEIVNGHSILRENTLVTSFFLHSRFFGRPPPFLG